MATFFGGILFLKLKKSFLFIVALPLPPPPLSGWATKKITLFAASLRKNDLAYRQEGQELDDIYSKNLSYLYKKPLVGLYRDGYCDLSLEPRQYLYRPTDGVTSVGALNQRLARAAIIKYINIL